LSIFNDFELLGRRPFSIVDNDNLICIQAASSVQPLKVKAEGLSGVAFGIGAPFQILNANPVLHLYY
jgi:hypothetical protein